MKEFIEQVKTTSVTSLSIMVMSALENANLKIEKQAKKFSNAQLPRIREESDIIVERFAQNLNAYFDALNSFKAIEPSISSFNDLTVMDDDYLEALIAMEGMVSHARNCDIQQYISFTTRLDAAFAFKLQIDETNNPLDPEQISDCFTEALAPMRLKSHYLLTVYREFNKAVFHHFEDVLFDANEILIQLGILPDMGVEARSKESHRTKRAANRPTTDRETRAFSEADDTTTEKARADHSNTEVFATMQALVHETTDRQEGSALPISSSASERESIDQHTRPGRTEIVAVEIIAIGEQSVTEPKDPEKQQAELLGLLTDIQSSLYADDSAVDGGSTSRINSTSITEAINKSLDEGIASGKIDPIDAQSSETMNLVALLFEAFWEDYSLPVVMQGLIGCTQIAIMKIALTEAAFFNDDQHPGRVILDELAMAGIAWTELELLDNDPVYGKVKELVERLLWEPKVTNDFLHSLINELRDFKSQHEETDASLEQRIKNTDDLDARLEDVNEYVRQKVNERILIDDLDPSIRTLLSTHYHDFLVKMVLKEGPGGSSWKPVMSTIDVLLWTVKANKLAGDAERFKKINPRLLDNLEKALNIGGTSKSKIKRIMRQLKQVQDYSFHVAENHVVGSPVEASSEQLAATGSTPPRQRKEPPPLPADDPHLRQVSNLPIGVWLEFQGAAGQPVRCTLAARIDGIDKLFFINRQGVKVVELTNMRLAREMKAGSVKIVSEGSLVDRAMQSVVSKLRETKLLEQSE